MKHVYRISRFRHILSLTIFISFFFPNKILADHNSSQDVEIFVSCVEDLGNGKLLAHFGYENPNENTVTVKSKESYIAYNYTRNKKYVLNTFEPGVHEKVFSEEFNSGDWVRWTVRFSRKNKKITLADNTSEICVGELPIIPGYQPPAGGKEYDSKIGAELTSLFKAYDFDPSNFEGATDAIFQLEGSRVLIEVVSESSLYETMMNSLSGTGFVPATQAPLMNRATGWVEIGVLLQLNDFSALKYARPVYPGVSNYIVPATGLTKSQGDFAMHADFARLGFDIDGSGFKIGVLSNSYDTRGEANIDVGNGDLPGPGNPNGYMMEVDVLKDIVPTHGTLSDEGRAMLQIVHDIAPGAELAFRTGFLGEQDMAHGIRELVDAGSDVIVDDLSYITEPFFRDGLISQTIDSVVAEGVTFFSSAGNFGTASYTGVYNAETAPSTITGTAHDFSGTGDIYQAVLLPEGDYTLVMQWDDDSDASMTTTTTDLDIFLSDDVGYSLLGFNRENVGGFPIEVVPFSVVGDSVYANVVVARASGPDVPVTFKYILFRGGSQFQMLEYGGGSSTIVGHPNAAGAISVGAVRFDKNPIYNPEEFPVPVIMSFSSMGGTPVDGVVRAKPDFTAPNGVNTTVDLGNGDWDSPIDPDVLYPNFFGTSAASPHAAGVAALILEARYKFESDSLVTPEDIRTLMKSTAIDMDENGEDHVSGSGFIQAHKALMTFANPSPEVENLILASEGGVPGEEITPFSFTITGDFFTDSTQVLFRGEALDEGVVVVDEGTIAVDHPGFIGNPEVQVYNPPISSGEQDGGFSEELHFSDPVKQTVVITADNLTKKYGEVLPVNTASFLLVSVQGDSLTLEEAVTGGIMLQVEADRLSTLSYSVPANDISDAGQYIIIPALDPALDFENPQTEIDNALTEKYTLEFVNGNLSIEKLALKITPRDINLGYGQQIPVEGIDFQYEIADSGLVLGDLGLVLADVEQEHTSALTNEIALVRGVALVNGIPVVRGTALVNGVKMIRGTALVNGIEVKVEIEGADTTVYVAGEAIANGARLIRGVALVNDLPFVNMTEIVRGTALVNGDEITFDDGYMTQLNGTLLVNKVSAVRGVALVNALGSRGLALVNGFEVVVENGLTTIDGVAVPSDGIVLVNGIPVVRGTALVNSAFISRGVALVNGLDIPVENGIPTGRAIALVNGIPTLRGVALVNGIPMLRGTALVNNLDVRVDDGEVTQIYENGVLLNGFSMSKGVALVNGIALVNGAQLSRGVALVNGIALVNEAGSGDDVVNLENMNLVASATALVNGRVPSVRGTALVNGIEGVDGEALKIATGRVQPDSSIIYEEVSVTNGIALVNGLAYVRGTALVNGSSPTKGTALVNGSSIDETTNSGTILVFDATDIGDSAQHVSFTPISFITGTTAGQHWIVPGAFISNNFEISYGLGRLTIDPADLAITAEDKSKTYGEADPALSYTESGLFPEDQLSGELVRDEGEDAGEYHILQGSVTAGDNYTITYDSATLSIDPAELIIEAMAEDKVYDGTVEAMLALIDNRLSGDSLSITYDTAYFADKHVGENKEVNVEGLSVSGLDAANYTANETAFDTATITAKELVIGITASDKPYDGNNEASTTAHVESGLVEGDTILLSSANGLFDTKDVGTDKPVTADVSLAGDDGGNYLANASAEATASITAMELVIGITASDKSYDGNIMAETEAYVVSGLVSEDAVLVSSTGGMFDTKDVGAGKAVTAAVFASGDDAGNYAINLSAEATASITARELVIGITASDKTYDGNTTAETEAYVESGLVEGDSILLNSANGLFNTKDVGTDKPVNADVSLAGVDGGNYLTNTSAETRAIIFEKELEIGLTAFDKIYDGNTVAETEAYVESGLVSEDAVTVSSSDGAFDDKHVGDGKAVIAVVSASGDDVGNYAFNLTAAAMASISARELVIGLTASDKIYDGNTAAETEAYVESGLVSEDVVSVSSTGGLFDNRNVGTGKAVTAAVSVSGDDARNYTANATAVAYADIFQKEVYVTPIAYFQFIHERDPLPQPAFNYEGWIAGDEGNEVYITQRYFDWKPYDPESDRAAGLYVLTPTPSNSNYSFHISKGKLWVLNHENHDDDDDDDDNKKSATVGGEIEEDETLVADELLAYPNPVIEKVHLSMKGIENYKMIQLFDFAGRSFPITSIDKRSDHLEIDMAQLSGGHYFIRIMMEDSSRVVQIIKK